MIPSDHRLNAIVPYFTMYPLSFPLEALSTARKGEWVLDPFCGRGTTNFAARLLGLPSVGIDSNPVAAAIARAKVVQASADEVIARCREMLLSVPIPKDVPEGEFWELCFHPETLRDICRLREAFRSAAEDPASITLKALILGVLHGPRYKGKPGYLSNQMPRTYATKPLGAVAYWIRTGLRPERVEVLDLVERRAWYTLSAVPESAGGKVLEGDSRLSDGIPEPPGGYRHIVTSPPYWGMRSYVPDQWLRNWFLGADPAVEYAHELQVMQKDIDGFILDLSLVWANCARVSGRGARLHIRFGALPSSPMSPEEIIRATFRGDARVWRMEKVKNAGFPKRSRRQAVQFNKNVGKPIDEIDVEAVLR